MDFKIPYGRAGLEFALPDAQVLATLTSKANQFEPDKGQQDLVDQALANPIDSPGLSELAKGKDNVVIICSDHTRPVPSKFMIPPMLEQIRKGNSDANIKLLIATGFHRPSTEAEMIEKLARKSLKMRS